MKNERTIQGRAKLVCGDAETTATYRLVLCTDQRGNTAVAGVLKNVDISFTLIVFQSSAVCHLILEDGRHIQVRISPHGDGIVDVYSLGPIPDL